ncbi:MAG: tetratricopeptide repeat protein, partial [Methanobacteriaceae archaeon]
MTGLSGKSNQLYNDAVENFENEEYYSVIELLTEFIESNNDIINSINVDSGTDGVGGVGGDWADISTKDIEKIHEAILLLGTSQYSVGFHEESIESFGKLLQMNSKDFDALFFKSWALYLTGQYEEALESTNMAYGISPISDIIFLEGSILLELGEYSNASEFFKLFKEEAEMDHDLYEDALFKEANCLYGEEKYNESLKILDSLLDSNSNLTSSSTSSSTSDSNSSSESISNSEDSKSVDILNFKSMVLMEMSNNDEAIATLEKAISMDNEWYILYL